MNLVNSLTNCCSKIFDPTPPTKDSLEKNRPQEHAVETVFRRTILYYCTDSKSCPKDRDREVLDKPVDKQMIHKLHSCIYKAIYEGDVLNDAAHGKGKKTNVTGSVYEGDFLYDKAHGCGKLTYGNGNVYEGKFQNGVPCGAGKITNTQGYRSIESNFACTNPKNGELTSADGTKFREGNELFSWH